MVDIEESRPGTLDGLPTLRTRMHGPLAWVISAHTAQSFMLELEIYKEGLQHICATLHPCVAVLCLACLETWTCFLVASLDLLNFRVAGTCLLEVVTTWKQVGAPASEVKTTHQGSPAQRAPRALDDPGVQRGPGFWNPYPEAAAPVHDSYGRAMLCRVH